MPPQSSLELEASTKVPLDPIHVAPVPGAPDTRSRLISAVQSAAPFLAVAGQMFLIVLLVLQFHLESMTFGRVLKLTFAGFLVHHFLPSRFRLPFFALLSVGATIAVLDPVPGGVLLGIGLVLIGACHLPIPFWGRVAVLAALGVGLCVARVNPRWYPGLDAMWPILGSMFGLRIFIYLYDLKHKNAPFSFTRAVSYFFMLPNVCFPLFPVVDYKTYCTNYFDDRPVRIYQTGIRWMFRGVIQLMLYRLVYHFGLLNIEDVFDARDAAEFMLATYLLYLHVSGQFHLIVGMLHMFGFSLPETHHLYLLASSFTDFWRRINIYWKDFIMKVFFYPAFFALRKMGTLKAMALATLGSFLATWTLHSWQWFWFRGRFLVTWQDISFWTILALLVLVNALNEAVTVRRKALTTAGFQWKPRLIVGLKTIGTFVVICALWTLWSCQSATELTILAESATHVSGRDVAIIAAFLLGIGAAGMVWGTSAREMVKGKTAAATAAKPREFWLSVAGTTVGAVALLAIPTLGSLGTPGVGRLLLALREDQLNNGDRDRQRRGYYEELDEVRGMNHWAWNKVQEPPAGWLDDRLFRDRDDFLRRDMYPSLSITECGTLTTTNRWGMRDRDYEKAKPEGRHRIVIAGSSHEVGLGVADGETFENLFEDRLNESVPAGEAPRYEVLNTAVRGYALWRKLVHLEQTGLEFQPDTVLFLVNTNDRSADLDHLTFVLQKQRDVPYDYLKDVFRRAGVRPDMPEVDIQRRLKRLIPEMYSWVFRRLVATCAERNIRLIVIFRPSPVELVQSEATRRNELTRLAREAGAEVLDLTPAFRSVSDPNSLILAPWDDHTNALGHRLVADELYAQVAPRLGSIEKAGGHRPPAQEIAHRRTGAAP